MPWTYLASEKNDGQMNVQEIVIQRKFDIAVIWAEI